MRARYRAGSKFTLLLVLGQFVFPQAKPGNFGECSPILDFQGRGGICFRLI